MTANQILGRMAARGIRITLNGDRLKIDAPAGMLTDEDRNRLKSYKAEILWRLRHPDGDPDAGDYTAKPFVNGERVTVTLAQLMAEGNAIIEREGLEWPDTKNPWVKFPINRDMWAASVAVSRYDQAHREWVEERAAIYEFDAGLSRQDANAKVEKEFVCESTIQF